MNSIYIFFIGFMLIFVSCDKKQNKVMAIPDVSEAYSLKLSMRTHELLDSLLQNSSGSLEDDPIEINCIIPPEIMPEFPGGQDALKKFLTKNTRWPKTTADTTGVVYVNFLVQDDGTVTEVNVIKGIHKDFDAEAVRVVKRMPRWKPGKRNGKKEATRLTLPIRFAEN